MRNTRGWDFFHAEISKSGGYVDKHFLPASLSTTLNNSVLCNSNVRVICSTIKCLHGASDVLENGGISCSIVYLALGNISHHKNAITARLA